MFSEYSQRIIFIIYTLEYGGSERFLSTLLNNLNRDRFSISIVLCKKEGALLKEIPRDVKIFDLNTRVSSYEFFEAALKISRIIKVERPHLVISICDWMNLATSFSRFFFGWQSRLVLREDTTLFQNYLLKGTKHTFVKKLLVRFLYPRADLVIVPSEGAKKDLQENFRVKPSHIKVIPNPLDIEKIKKLSSEDVSHPWLVDKKIPVIVSIGRLVRLKNFAWLIKIFWLLEKKRKLRLLIIGDGPERKRLEKLVKILNVNRDVQFLGRQDNPFKFVAKSDIFVLPSLLESFSYVLVEAMACGVPVVSVDCPSGPGEIIKDGVSGFLVRPGDKEEMVRKILVILQDMGLRKRFVENGMSNLEKFKVDRILQEYGKVFGQVLG